MCAPFALQYTLPKTVSTAELRDMLLIAVNMPHPEPAEAILLFDKQQHKQLLYASGSNTSNSTSSSGGSSSSSSGSSTAQLVEQLITTAVIRRHWRLAPLLAATPAAQQLGLPALTQLLSVCIHLERVPVQHPGLPAGYFYFPVQPAAQDTVAPCLQLLCALPAAAGMTPSTAASLMRLAVKQQQYKLAERLVALPAAQQLAAPQLFELLLLLLPQNTARLRQHTQRNSLVERLTALPSGKQLAPSAARQLFSMVLEQRPSELSLAMLQLQSLGQEGQLTSSDVLQLLQQAAKQGCGDAIAGIATLAAAQQIDDVDGFAAFLQTALAHGIGESIMTEAVVRLPVLQQLGPHAVLGILQSGLKAFRLDPSRSHPRSAYRFIVEHPAVSSFSTETLGQLLLEAGQQRCLVDTVHQTHDSVHRASTLRFYGMAALLKAPAAVGLPVATVASLLQHAAQERVRHRIQEGEPWQHSDEEDDSCCDQPFALDAMQPFLVALPAAQQLDADAIVRVLTAAVTANNAAGVRSVCPLPGTQQVSAEAALELLQQAAAQGCKLWLAVRSALPQLAALPAGQLQLTSQQLYSFLQEAVTTADSRSVGSLCKLVGEAGDAEAALFSISSDAMQQLLATAVTFYSPSHRAVHAAEQLVALAAARALGPDAVAALLESCVKRYNAAGVTLVGQLPAASQLSQQVAEKLLLQCLLGRHQIDSTGYAQCANAGPTVCALVQLPAVQRLAADAVTRVLLAGITERMQDEWWVLSRLPLAKHGALSRGAVRQLLQAAYEVQQWDMFDWLVELPAAPRHDDEEEVAILRAVRACQSAQ
jgi:hypothetical protein